MARLWSVIETALDNGPLRVIERERLDALVREQDLTADGRVHRDSAIQLGGLLGGHVALIAMQIDGQLALRSVIVETGELADVRLIPASDTYAAVGEVIAASCQRLEARGMLAKDAVVGHSFIDVGADHGVQMGDAFELIHDGKELGAQVLAELQIVSVERGRAQVTAKDGRGLPQRGYVRKVLP